MSEGVKSTEIVKRPLTYCNKYPDFVDFIKEMRNSDSEELIQAIGLDGGGGSIKVTLNLVPPPPTDFFSSPPKKKLKLVDPNAALDQSAEVAKTDADVVSSTLDDDPDYVPPSNFISENQKNQQLK